MPPVAKFPIWYEKLEELAARWRKRQEAMQLDPGPEADELARRMYDRAEAVRLAIGLEPGRPLSSYRQWTALWDPEKAEARLRAGFQKLGWNLLVTGGPAPPPAGLGAFAIGDDNTVVVETPLAASLAESFRRRGLGLPFGPAEGVILLAAEELFALGSEHLGQRPRLEIVEHGASKAFAQRVLGWPFCPWAAEYL